MRGLVERGCLHPLPENFCIFPADFRAMKSCDGEVIGFKHRIDGSNGTAGHERHGTIYLLRQLQELKR